jgi:hypothetical protein
MSGSQKEHLDTLQDIQKSCTVALDILNDLLCFNKLESGVLELHREQVKVVGFVRESVAMFNVQVPATTTDYPNNTPCTLCLVPCTLYPMLAACTRSSTCRAISNFLPTLVSIATTVAIVRLCLCVSGA